MAEVVFEDNHIKVENAIAEKVIAFLYEAIAELQAQTVRNNRVKTGQTKGSWETLVDEETLEALLGSTAENAIWEEFGTGEYALNENGRKGGWSYQDEEGIWHHTRGKSPQRPLWNAAESTKAKISQMAEKRLKELDE